MASAVLVLLALAPALVFGLVGNDRQESTTRAPWNATWTDTLKRTLLSGYDKFARPSHHQASTNVSLGLTITHVELEDTTGIMTLHGWISMEWNDEKLKWNSTDYGDLRNLHVADHEIWQPDIVQYNSASGSQVDQYGNTHCIVSENGKVIWVPPTKLTTFCNMDYTKWPSDEHVCTYTFGSWTYDEAQISLNSKEDVTLDGTVVSDAHGHFMESGEWNILKVSHARHEKVYPCCADSVYVSVDYKVSVSRKGGVGARGVLVKAPVAVAALLSLLSHCLPPRSTMAPRLPLAVAPPSILALSLLYFSNRLPATSEVPDIVMLYSIILYMVCISSVVSVVVLNLSLSTRALPWAVRRALCSRGARSLRLPKIAEASAGVEEMQETGGSAGGGSAAEEGAHMITVSPAPARDWLALATAIDRIFFIVLLLVFIVAAFVYGC